MSKKNNHQKNQRKNSLTKGWKNSFILIWRVILLLLTESSKKTHSDIELLKLELIAFKSSIFGLFQNQKH